MKRSRAYGVMHKWKSATFEMPRSLEGRSKYGIGENLSGAGGV